MEGAAIDTPAAASVDSISDVCPWPTVFPSSVSGPEAQNSNQSIELLPTLDTESSCDKAIEQQLVAPISDDSELPKEKRTRIGPKNRGGKRGTRILREKKQMRVERQAMSEADPLAEAQAEAQALEVDALSKANALLSDLEKVQTLMNKIQLQLQIQGQKRGTMATTRDRAPLAPAQPVRDLPVEEGVVSIPNLEAETADMGTFGRQIMELISLGSATDGFARAEEFPEQKHLPVQKDLLQQKPVRTQPRKRGGVRNRMRKLAREAREVAEGRAMTGADPLVDADSLAESEALTESQGLAVFHGGNQSQSENWTGMNASAVNKSRSFQTHKPALGTGDCATRRSITPHAFLPTEPNGCRNPRMLDCRSSTPPSYESFDSHPTRNLPRVLPPNRPPKFGKGGYQCIQFKPRVGLPRQVSPGTQLSAYRCVGSRNNRVDRMHDLTGPNHQCMCGTCCSTQAVPDTRIADSWSRVLIVRGQPASVVTRRGELLTLTPAVNLI